MKKSISIALKSSEFSKQVNAVGMEAYNKGFYWTARHYFRIAWILSEVTDESNSLLPLYNIAVVEAKMKKAQDSLPNLEKLLKYQGSRKYFQNLISENHDFDSIRGESKYIELMELN